MEGFSQSIKDCYSKVETIAKQIKWKPIWEWVQKGYEQHAENILAGFGVIVVIFVIGKSMRVLELPAVKKKQALNRKFISDEGEISQDQPHEKQPSTDPSNTNRNNSKMDSFIRQKKRFEMDIIQEESEDKIFFEVYNQYAQS